MEREESRVDILYLHLLHQNFGEVHTSSRCSHRALMTSKDALEVFNV